MHGERQVKGGDVAVPADDARLAERLPVDQVVKAGRAVAPLLSVHHVNAGLAQRPLQIRGTLLVGARQVAVDLAVVGPEHDAVTSCLEVRRRLFDPGASAWGT